MYIICHNHVTRLFAFLSHFDRNKLPTTSLIFTYVYKRIYKCIRVYGIFNLTKLGTLFTLQNAQNI